MTALDEAAAALAANDMARVEAIAREILKTQPAHPVALHLLAAALSATGPGGRGTGRLPVGRGMAARQPGADASSLRAECAAKAGLSAQGHSRHRRVRGAFARTARHFFAQSPILMLEAQPGEEVQLKAIAAQLPDVDYRIVLLGAENRADVAFHHVNAAINSSGSSLYDEQTSYPRDTISLPMRTLDDVLAEMPGREFDLLKIDVQGAEIDVLRGAGRTLAGVEAIVIELSLLEYNKGAPPIGETMRWLGEQGFALFDVFPLSRIPAGALLQGTGFSCAADPARGPRRRSSEPPAKRFRKMWRVTSLPVRPRTTRI